MKLKKPFLAGLIDFMLK